MYRFALIAIGLTFAYIVFAAVLEHEVFERLDRRRARRLQR
jgi:hypothetical protein